MNYQDKTVTITQVDNGYVLEWRDESRRNNNAHTSAVWPPLPDPQTSGKEIFSDLKKAVKRLNEIML